MDTKAKVGGQILKGPGSISMPKDFSVFTGCYNEWGRVEYWQNGAFAIDLETVRSASTCGSPVFSSGTWWVGFLRDSGGKVHCDGKEVIFEFGEGQDLLVFEDQPRNGEHWEEYRKLVTEGQVGWPTEILATHYAQEWEYCTWVEQKRRAGSGRSPRAVVCDAMVRELAEKVLRLGLPPGKFTIDDGWQQLGAGSGWTDGYWRPNEDAFPSLEQTCGFLRKEGFVPGLWFGIGWYPENADILTAKPGLFGAWESQGEAESALGKAWSLASNDEVDTYLRGILRPYVEMGFKKFKFDFFYGERRRSNAVMKAIYRAVKSLDPEVEVEGHHFDFFYSRWTDSVRLNDVLIQPGRDWEGLTLSHLRVSQLCAPDRIINMDHLGGNDPQVGEADFNRHMDLLDRIDENQPRYPVLSLLPDLYSSATVKRTLEFVERHRKAVPTRSGD